jgi:NACHT N-terminal Helical domain 1/NACHT domain
LRACAASAGLADVYAGKLIYMSGLEIAVVKLAGAVVRSACMLWVGDREAAADASSRLVDLFEGRVSSRIEQRKVERMFDECADIVAGRVMKLLDHDFANLAENERNAAVLAAHETFARARLTENSLFRVDLDPRLLERQLQPVAAQVLRSALLNEPAEQLFLFLIRESCAYLVEIIVTLPGFEANSFTELLSRQTVVLAKLQMVLDQLPIRREVNDFAADYRRQISIILDRMELFGARLQESSRSYRLSIAYLSLSAVSYTHTRLSPSSIAYLSLSAVSHSHTRLSPSSIRQQTVAREQVDQVLLESPRTLLIGEAGSGKTTLLRWLAVRCARRDLPAELGEWNNLTPFIIQLRRYVDQPLPRPEQFLDSVAGSIADEMPSGWVQNLLRNGEALILIDGVDELPLSERDLVRRWLFELITVFPNSYYLISSRPEAIAEGWLDFLRFRTAELQPMSPPDVREFVSHWHKAIAEGIADLAKRDELAALESAMIKVLEGDRHLRRLAVSPLLCALLCALNRELRTKLPRSRLEIYEAALSMLVEQRDRERGVESPDVLMTRTEKTLLLQNLALWLVRNGKSYASAEEAVEQLASTLRTLRREEDRLDPDIILCPFTGSERDTPTFAGG